MRTINMLTLTTWGLFAALPGWSQEKIASPMAAPGPAAACAPGCLEKTCIAVPTTTKKTKVEYSCQEKDICLPKCGLAGLFHRGGGHGHTCGDDCPNAGCTQCGKPRTVRVLMKRVVTTECPDTKCEAVLRPAAARCAEPCLTPAAVAPAIVPSR